MAGTSCTVVKALLPCARNQSTKGADVLMLNEPYPVFVIDLQLLIQHSQHAFCPPAETWDS